MLAESWNAVVPCRAPDVATRAHQSRCTLFSPTAGRGYSASGGLRLRIQDPVG